MIKLITSSPILAHFDPTEPVFLKTDWSAEGMACIPTKPDDDEESEKPENNIVTTGEYDFDLDKNGESLQPVSS